MFFRKYIIREFSSAKCLLIISHKTIIKCQLQVSECFFKTLVYFTETLCKVSVLSSCNATGWPVMERYARSNGMYLLWLILLSFLWESLIKYIISSLMFALSWMWAFVWSLWLLIHPSSGKGSWFGDPKQCIWLTCSLLCLVSCGSSAFTGRGCALFVGRPEV